MPVLSGPKLDKLKEELRTWYLDTRERLIQALEEGGYPYGSIPLTPSEQVERFFSMTPEDWQDMIASLTERHRGEPNAQELVRKDLEEFASRMNKLAFTRRVG